MNEPLRLHVGGKQPKEGWKILNIMPGPHVDYVGNCTCLTQFADNSVDEVYASHVLEHLGFRTELPMALKEIWRILKPGGVFRVSVPDLKCLCKLFVHPQVPMDERFSLMLHMFGAQEDEYDFHKIGFTRGFLVHFLSQAGFTHSKRVDEFGLFDDYSSFRRFGVLISLNMEAYK